MPRDVFAGEGDAFIESFSEMFKQQDRAREEVSSSSDALDSAIDNLDARIVSVEASLAGLGTSLPAAEDNEDLELAQVVDRKVAPIAAELASIRADSISNLQQTRASLQQAEGAIRDAFAFQVKVIEDSYRAVDRRMTVLEDRAKEGRATLIAIVSLVIAIASVLFGCVGFFIALYVALQG